MGYLVVSELFIAFRCKRGNFVFPFPIGHTLIKLYLTFIRPPDREEKEEVHTTAIFLPLILHLLFISYPKRCIFSRLWVWEKHKKGDKEGGRVRSPLSLQHPPLREKQEKNVPLIIFHPLPTNNTTLKNRSYQKNSRK